MFMRQVYDRLYWKGLQAEFLGLIFTLGLRGGLISRFY